MEIKKGQEQQMTEQRAGRSAAGRLRNFKQMTDKKLAATHSAVWQQKHIAPDAEAMAAIRAELDERKAQAAAEKLADQIIAGELSFEAAVAGILGQK